ncbi:hypothetical protein AB3662_04020 [Sorangium cellulosum]|uniref:hypothetical protein n=1 Tax=Sorangium cellulosum TaxID=56 RepID=UPI003D9A75CE
MLNSGSVKSVTVMPDGTILGVGAGDKGELFTRATLTSPWVHVPNSGSVKSVTVMPDGTILGVGAGDKGELFTRATLTSPWVNVPNSGTVIGVAVKPGTIAGNTVGDVLKYGDRVHIQNGHQSWQGGYLDTCGASTTGIKYGVSTADTPTRAAGTGTWEILSATGKASGQEVLSGDVLYLKNLYQDDGGYLDSSGASSPDPCIYQVGTAAKPDRDSNGTSRWRVFARTSSPIDKKVRENDVVHFFNETTYNNVPGGFLDTYGAATGNATGINKHGVVTGAYVDRAGTGTGSWRMIKVRP